MHLFSSGLSNFQRNKYSLVQLHSLHPSPFSGFPTIVLGRVGSVLVYLSEWLIRFNFVCSLPYCPFLLWLITLLQSPNKWSRYLVFIFGSFPQPKCIEPLHRQQFRNSWPGFLPLTAALDMASVLTRRGRDAMDAHSEEGNVRTQQKDGCLQARKRNRTCQHLHLGPPSLRNCEQIIFCHLSHLVCGLFRGSPRGLIQKLQPRISLSTLKDQTSDFLMYALDNHLRADSNVPNS